MKAVIMTGVTIHEGAIVVAGSVVTKDVAPIQSLAAIPQHSLNNGFLMRIL